MPFYRYEPPESLRGLIECYWMVDDETREPQTQKIIPDGYPEIIFHFGDPYRIKLHKDWELQPKTLLAGQLTRYFYIENTGTSFVFGIKFQPSALTHLFDIAMRELTDKVVELRKKIPGIHELEPELKRDRDHRRMITIVNDYLTRTASGFVPGVVDHAVSLIFSTQGKISIGEICDQTKTGERQLERLFNRYIGLTPKFYCRVIRFSFIFKVIQNKRLSWADLGLEAGFYDQPHFIRNFKAFSGEDPSKYFFNSPTLANFFLRK
jgi:AraC-like DNA-binding protein